MIMALKLSSSVIFWLSQVPKTKVKIEKQKNTWHTFSSFRKYNYSTKTKILSIKQKQSFFVLFLFDNLCFVFWITEYLLLF